MDKLAHDLNIDYKGYLFRFALAALLTVGVYAAVDFWTLRNWKANESLVVEVERLGEEKILPQDDEDPFTTVEWDLSIRVLTGTQKGQLFSITITQMEGGGIDFKKGERYILLADVFDDGTVQYSIADVFRIPSVVGVVVFACACLIAFAGRAGTMALLGLGLSVACLLWGYIPLVAHGAPPIALAFLAVFFISVATVFCVVRRKQARIVALLGTLGGAGGAFFLGYCMVELWQLSGLAEESASLLVTTIAGIDIKGVLLAAIIVSSIGAVLDVGISITAAMSELVEYDPQIAPLRLWSAGTRVGSEVLGSMINTLILAYLGTSLPLAILISNAGADFWGLMNDPYVAQEIVQSIAGTSGLLLTIPITATFFVLREKILGRSISEDTPLPEALSNTQDLNRDLNMKNLNGGDANMQDLNPEDEKTL